MPTPVTLYADADGALSFYPEAPRHGEPVEFELADGYRIGEGMTGVRMVFSDKPGSMGMSLSDALAAKVLRLVFDQRIASVEE